MSSKVRVGQFVAVVLGLAFSVQSFAACEWETQLRDEFRGHADGTSKAATTICAAGTAAAAFTFGASLIPCAPAVAAAENQKRILREKEDSLRKCLTTYAESQRVIAAAAEVRTQQIAAINESYKASRQKLIDEFEGKALQIRQEYREQGYDIENESVKAEIGKRVGDLQDKLNRKLEDLESERTKAVAGV